MPSARFFTHLGLFVRPRFVDREGCKELMSEASRAPSEPCRLVRHGVDEILDEQIRSTTSALVSRETRVRMKERFRDVIPELETHFAVRLADNEAPGFLVYESGAFFSAHADTGVDDPREIRRRRVSAILFLNGRDDYEGGSLRFHRLLDGPHWENCPLSFDPEPGMLLAFRSDVVHEVLPVTSGRRFTVVTWFLAGEP